jgi:hypothetical protein
VVQTKKLKSYAETNNAELYFFSWSLGVYESQQVANAKSNL